MGFEPGQPGPRVWTLNHHECAAQDQIPKMGVNPLPFSVWISELGS